MPPSRRSQLQRDKETTWCSVMTQVTKLSVTCLLIKNTHTTSANLLGPAQRKYRALDVKLPTIPILQQDWYKLWNTKKNEFTNTKFKLQVRHHILLFGECEMCLATTAAGWGVTSLFPYHHCVVNCLISGCCCGDAPVVRWDSASSFSPEYLGLDDEKKRRVFPDEVILTEQLEPLSKVSI